MTSQVPYGPKEYPQFATGYAQYPPAQDHYAPAAPAQPATYQAGGYQAVAYPQEGADGFPQPVAYPQLTVPTTYGSASGQFLGDAAAAAPQEADAWRRDDTADFGAAQETRGMRLHGAHRPAEEAPHADAYPSSGGHLPPATGHTRAGQLSPASDHAPAGTYQPDAPAAGPVGYAQAGSPAGFAPAGGPAGYAETGSPTGYALPGSPAGYAPAGDQQQAPAYSGTDGATPPGGAYPSAYPTAPPWAATTQTSPAPAPAHPGQLGHPGHPGQPVMEHGTLLVPYPDEMRNASRAHPPAVWPVTVFTLFFVIPGVISAARRAADARRGRNSIAPYWITFLVTFAAAAFIWFVVGAVVIVPFLNDVREGQRLAAVQDALIHDGQLQKANVIATDARCRAIAERDAEGMREYLCRLTLDNGRTATLTVTADANGNWVTRNSE